MNLERGERNHNPFNLETVGHIPWQGLIGNDGPYCVFANDLMGLRAGFRDLHNAWAEGYRTIATLCAHFAPADDDNNVAAYVADVAARAGVAADEPLHLNTPEALVALGAGFIHHEQGRVIYSAELLTQAARMALGLDPGAST